MPSQLEILHRSLKANNFDVPDDYELFKSALTAKGDEGYNNRLTLWKSLKANNYDVPDDYNTFRDALFSPVKRRQAPAAVPQGTPSRGRQTQGAPSQGRQTQGSASQGSAINKSAEITAGTTMPMLSEGWGDLSPEAGLPSYMRDEAKRRREESYGADEAAVQQRRRIAQTMKAVRGDRQAAKEVGLDRVNQQLRDRMDYTMATGKELKHVLDEAADEQNAETGLDLNALGIAPTVARDEQGNVVYGEDGQPLRGQVSDEVRAGAQMVEEERVRQADLQMQIDEANAELARLQEEAQKVETPDYVFGQDALSPYADPRTSNSDMAAISAARRQTEERIKALEEEMQGGRHGFFSGMMDAAKDPSTWLMGLDKVGDNINMLAVSEKVKNGQQLTQAEQAMLDATIANNTVQQRLEEGSDWQYRAGRMTTEMIPFMGQIMFTGGFGSVAAVGERMGQKWATAYARKFGEKALLNRINMNVLRGFGVAMGDVAAGFASANTTGAVNTLNDAMQRRVGQLGYDEKGDYAFTDDEDWLRAIMKAEVSQTKEFATERFGEHLPGLRRLNVMLAKQGPRARAVARALRGFAGTKAMQKTSQWLRKGGVNGVFGEVLEEEIGLPVDVAIGDMTWDEALSQKTQWDIVGGMLLSMGAMHSVGLAAQGVGKVYNTTQYYRYKRAADNASTVASFRMTAEKWEPLKETIDGTTSEDMSALWDKIRDDGTLAVQEKRAAYDYINALTMMRGYNMGMLFSAREAAKDGRLTPGETTPEEDMAASLLAADDEGRMADMPDEKKRYVDEADAAGARLREIIGDDNLADDIIMAQNASEMLGNMLGSRSFSNEEVAAVADYYQKRARAQGVMDAALEGVDLLVAEANAEVLNNSHQDMGQVVTVTVGDQSYYVIGGDLSIGDDGIDVAASGQALVVKNATTGEVEVMSPQQMLLQGVVSTQDLIDQNETGLREQLMQQADDDITFGSPANETFELNDEVTLSDGEGGIVEGVITGSTPDGALLVESAGGVAPMTVEELNRRVVVHNGIHVSLSPNADEGTDAENLENYAQNEGTDTENLENYAQNEGENILDEEVQERETAAVPQPTQSQEYQTAEGEAELADVDGNADSDAMPMIGDGEDAEPDFSRAEPERAHRFIYDEAGLNRGEADQFIDANKKAADSALEKLQKKQPKIGTSLAKYRKEQAAWQQQVDEVQQQVDYWANVQQIQQERVRAEQEAEFQARQEEAAGRQALLDEQRDLQAKVAVAKRMYGDYFDDDFTVPHDVMELVALNMPRNISWEGREGVRGLQQELGVKRGIGRNADTHAFNGYLARKGEGIGAEQAVHNIWESEMNELPNGEKRFDDMEIRNAMLDMFMSAEKPGDIRDYVLNARIAEAETTRAAEDEDMRAAELEAWADAYHLEPEEREAFEAYMQYRGEEISSLTDVDIQNIIAIFAETNIENHEQNRESAGLDRESDGGGTSSEVEGGEGEIFGQSTSEDSGSPSERGEVGAGYEVVPGDNVAGGTSGNGIGGAAVVQQPTGQQTGADLDNVGGEAGVGSTEANDPSATAPNPIGAEVAAEWLLSSGQNAINSSDYLMKALSGVFPNTTAAIESIRQKYTQQLADPSVAEIKNFATSDLFKQIMQEVRDAVRTAYPNNAEVEDILDIIMQHPTGLPSRIGRDVQRKLDTLASQTSNNQPPLTKAQADQLLAQMETQAVADPETSLTQEAWVQTFGLNNSMQTPIGNVKMGEHQYQKLIDKNRSKEFGMVVQTLQDPDVVLVEPSQALEGQETERPYSLVFVKTFVRNGERIKFYASVTVQRDNMEVSISSHYMNANRVKERLTTLERIYTKQALIPNSSEWHLAEQQNAVPDLLPTQESNASFVGKDTNNSPNTQEKLGKSSSAEEIAEQEARVDTNEHRADGEALTPDGRESALRDAVVEHLRSIGVEVSDDWEQGQRVLDMVNGKDATLSKAQKRLLDTAPLIHKEGSPADISSSDGAKVLKNLGNLASELENFSSWRKNILSEVADALGAKAHGSNSKYATFVTKGGQTITVRLGNHNANTASFDNNGEDNGISIVISRRANSGINNNGNAHLVEFFYPEIALRKAEGKPLADIVRSLQQALYSGEYKDTTGLAEREEVNADMVRQHRVYHGSGADFDRFDHSHMGEGEGAQAYGWGSYVTEVEGIGRTYASQGRGKFSYRGRSWEKIWHDNHTPENMAALDVIEQMENGYTFAEAVDYSRKDCQSSLESFADDPDYASSAEHYRGKLKALDEMREGDFPKKDNILYTVEIPDKAEADYLEIDTPLSEQGDILERVDNELTARGWRRQEVEGKLRFTKEGSKDIELDSSDSGADLYSWLTDGLGSDRAASEFLHDVGVTGMEYPADYMSGGNSEGKKNYVIYDENDLKITDKVKFFKTADGQAYGYTYRGKIYIDPRIATSETPIHEYSHLWVEMKRQTAPEEWGQMRQVMLTDKAVQPIIERVRRDYPELTKEGREDDFIEEIITQFSGKRGAERLREIADEVAAERGGIFGKAEAVTAMQRLKNVLNRFWEGVARMMGWKYRNADEVADRIMADMLNGVNPRERMKEAVSGRDDILFQKKGAGENDGATAFHHVIDEMFDNEDFDKSAHQRERYDLGTTPEWMKNIGITGEKFSLSFKNIKTHIGKDADHNLSREEWHQLPEAIKKPFLVTKHKDAADKFRLYVNIVHNGHYVAVGVDVKRVNQGKNKPMLEVNSIKTVFGHKEKLSPNEVVLTYDKEITPEQEALLRGLDYREYPTIQELSAAKVVNNPDTAKKSEGNVGDVLNNELGTLNRDSEEIPAPRRKRARTAREQRQAEAYAQRQWRRAHVVAEEAIRLLGLEERVTVMDFPIGLTGKRAQAKGWYDTKTGKIVVVMNNHRSPEDVFKTILHEGVAHYGLRELFGDHFDTFLDEVYENASPEIRTAIDAGIPPESSLFGKGRNTAAVPQRTQSQERQTRARREATEEYLARLAEDTDFERAMKQGWWQRIKSAFLNMLHKLGFGEYAGPALTDNELRYILWRSYENLQDMKRVREGQKPLRRNVWNPLKVAEDIVMQKKLQVGNFDEAAVAATVPQRTQSQEQSRAVGNNQGKSRATENKRGGLNTASMKPRNEAERAYVQFKERYGDAVLMMRDNESYFALGDDALKMERLFAGNSYVHGVMSDGRYSIPISELDMVLPVLVRARNRVAIADAPTGNTAREGDPEVEWQDGRSIMERLAERYNSKELVFFDLAMDDKDLFEALGNSLDSLEGISPDFFSRGMKEIRRQIDDGEILGVYNPISGKIHIFADERSAINAEEIFFHENIHAILQDLYGDLQRGIALRFWELSNDDNQYLDKKIVRNYDADEQAEEFFTACLGRAMVNGDVDAIEKILSSDSGDLIRLNNILKSIGYDRNSEANRRKVQGFSEGVSENDFPFNPIFQNAQGDGRRGGNLLNVIGYDRERETTDRKPRRAEDVSEESRRQGLYGLQVQEELDDGLRFRSGDETASYDHVMQEGFTQLREAWQDSMISVRVLQDAILKARSEEKDWNTDKNSFEDAYNAENRMHGISRNEDEYYKRNLFDPLMDAFHGFMKHFHLSESEAVRYMVSKTGLERNQFYAFSHAAKQKAKEAIEKQKADLKKQFDAGSIDSKEYLMRQRKLDDSLRDEARKIISSYKNDFRVKQIKDLYGQGAVTYSELLSKLEEVRKSYVQREKPERDDDGNVVSDNYYDENVRDYSGLSGLLGGDRLAEINAMKAEARGTVDKKKARKMWSAIDKKIRDLHEETSKRALGVVADVEVDKNMKRLLETNVIGLIPYIRGTETRRNAYKDLWEKVNASTAWTLKKSYESSLISRDNYEYIKGMFDFYMPLRGWDGTEAHDEYDYVNSPGTSYSPTVVQTHGRLSAADNPLAYIRSMATSAIVSGNKNVMKEHFRRFVKNHPSQLVTLDKQWYERIGTDADGVGVWVARYPDIPENATADEVAGIVESFTEEMRLKAEAGVATQHKGHLHVQYPQTKAEAAEHHVEVVSNGETYVLYINGDPRAAQALNGTRRREAQREAGESSRVADFNRWLAAAYTSYSPSFTFANLARDLGMATAVSAIKESPGYTGRLIGNLTYLLSPRFCRGGALMPYLMNRYLNGELDMDKATEKYFYEFMTYGGETGFTALQDIDNIKEMMEREFKKENRSQIDPRRALSALGDGLEYVNRCIEDLTRFATYMTSREMGRGVDQSITDAKNITLNFNRKGTGEKGNATLRNLYVFVNPAVQSLHTLAHLARHCPKAFTLVTCSWAAAGAVVPLLNGLLISLFGGDDDKEVYWSLPTYVRRQNFCLYLPWVKRFVQIPLAQEFRVFYGLGEAVTSFLSGRATFWDSAFSVVEQFLDLLPLDFTGSGGNPFASLSPTALKPATDIAFNTSFSGYPIWKETPWNKDEPAFQKAYSRTPSFLVSASQTVNSWTGGNDHLKGWWERTMVGKYANNPAVVQHVLNGYLGGMYSFLTEGGGTLWTAVHGELPQDMQVPVWNRFVNNPFERNQGGGIRMGDAYWKLIDESRETESMFRGFKKDTQSQNEAVRKRGEEITAMKDAIEKKAKADSKGETFVSSVEIDEKLERRWLRSKTIKEYVKEIDKQKGMINRHVEDDSIVVQAEANIKEIEAEMVSVLKGM